MAATEQRTPPEDVSIAWAPLPGSQRLFLSCNVEEALYEGTRGPGKTEALLADYARDVGQGYGDYWRGIVFRQTYKQLSDLVIKSQRLFYSIFPGARFNKSEYSWRFPDGEMLFFRQMRVPDDYWDYHGHEYPWIAFEELTSWRDLQCYDAMKSCWRSPRLRMPRRYRATTNPFGIGHRAVKERFILPAPRGQIIKDAFGNRRVAIHGSVYENLYLLKADPMYVARLEAIRDANVRKAWLHGSWDINAGGAVDDVWDEKKHIIQPFKVPETWQITRSFDWGSARPFSAGWWVMSDGQEVRQRDGTTRAFPPGTKIRIHELYGSNGQPNEGLRWSNTKIGAEMRQIERDLMGDRVQPGAADSSIFDKSNGFNKSIAEEMEKEGIYFLPADKGPGSRRRRLSFLRNALENALPDRPEKPGLYAFDTCRDYRSQIPTLPRDPDDYECVDSGGEDHLYDEATYELSRHSSNFTSLSL